MKKKFLIILFLFFPLAIHAGEKNLLRPETITALESAILEVNSEQKQFFLKSELENLESSPKKTKEKSNFQTYFPKALSLHNMFLFSRAQGLPGNELNQLAQSLYKKARKKASPLQTAKCNVLLASLLLAEANGEKANKMLEDIDPLLFDADYNIVLYHAHYFAEKHDVQQSLSQLQKAFELRSQETLDIIAISDDFFLIKNEEAFQEQVKKWEKQNAHLAFPIHLKVPKAKHARIRGEWKSVRYKWSLQTRAKRKSPLYLKQFKPLKI